MTSLLTEVKWSEHRWGSWGQNTTKWQKTSRCAKNVLLKER